MTVFTIGFTKTSAENFFNRLRDAGVKKLLDVRLNNTSQLAGFAKARDLRFFLRELAEISYRHDPMLAPTKEILDEYKKNGGDWERYTASFMKLMEQRGIEHRLTPSQLEGTCLLCSENTPEQCHRRLVLEYLNEKWDGALEIVHL